MPKIYNTKDVYTAAMERLEYIFDSFDHYLFSVSGGKDSSVMLQLAAKKAREKGVKFSVLYIDLEAQYKATITHIEELITEVEDVLEKWYWIALPLSLRNAVSIIQPKWICWNKPEQNRWVRDMPQNKWIINEENYPKEWTWFHKGMEFEEFTLYFSLWFQKKFHGTIACGIGIRSKESLNRFRTIINKQKECYEGKKWTTRVKKGGKLTNVYNFYPIYDWDATDIWTAISKLNLKYNQIYEQLYKNGVSIYEQRLCQPYGDDQKKSLDQFKSLEYETWDKVLNRVHGVNFGNIYCKTGLLGFFKTEKPETMTWQQYTVFLLESIGLYAPELRDHYYRKIKIFLNWHEKKSGLTMEYMQDEADKKLENAKKVASWRRIARAIEHNDFWLKSLSFSQSKSDVKKLIELHRKYKNIIDPNTTNKEFKKVIEIVRGEESERSKSISR